MKECHTTIVKRFYKRYLPMEKMFEHCGSEFLFKDEENNLISVVVRYVPKENEAERIKYVHDKRVAFEEIQKDKAKRKEVSAC